MPAVCLHDHAVVSVLWLCKGHSYAILIVGSVDLVHASADDGQPLHTAHVRYAVLLSEYSDTVSCEPVQARPGPGALDNLTV